MTDINDYDFHLPSELVAQFPLACRSDSRLMIVDRATNSIDHAHVRDLPNWIAAEDCVVLNDTRVLPARLIGRRSSTGGRWSGLFLEADEHGIWKVLSKTRGKLEAGETIALENRNGVPAETLTLIAKLDGGMWAVKTKTEQPADEILARVGRVPIPPYVRGGVMVDADVENYQTVYAAESGAVAAPTAGLHFTPELLSQLVEAGTKVCPLTLHVGVGTFRPVTAERLEDHDMHVECGHVSELTSDVIRERQGRGGRVVAIGTTVVRVLETASASGAVQPWSGETNLFIKPGYNFRTVDALMTNFHLPKSTLLVLVRTFGGDDLVRRAYETAIEEGYRFYSYGDAMLIL